MSEERTPLSAAELSRYAKHIKLAHIGLDGQIKLKQARVLCVGAGGLGSPLLLYLAAAGVGTIGIVDDDVVQLDNLQRQILYQSNHVDVKKVLQAKNQLNALNPHIHIEIYPQRLTLANAAELITQYDIVADCSDNFATRYLVNDVCFYLKKPFVSASISQFEGQCTFFLGSEAPCYRCLFPALPAMQTMVDCATAGVLGVLPGILGTIQATEILKWILQIGDLLTGRLLMIDALKMQFREIQFQKNPECELCVYKKPLDLLALPESCDSLNGISVQELKAWFDSNKDIQLLDVRTAQENEMNNIGGILIPLSELSHRLNELNTQKPIVVYCQSGKRSLQALKILSERDFKSIRYLQGGLNEWDRIRNQTSAHNAIISYPKKSING